MCTLEKAGNIFYLTLTGNDEHRLNPTLIATLRSTLAQVKSQSVKGSVLITKADGRFFSNGFDLKYAQAGGSAKASIDRLRSMVDSLKPVVADFMSLPIPTIAAVTGHAAAAGLLLAMSHDYIMMRSDKGVLYMSELDIDFSDDRRVFILDMYNPGIYPLDFEARRYIDLKVEVKSGTATDEYLTKLDHALEVAEKRFDPDFIVYNAGTDILDGDPLGRLKISSDGIASRDEKVFRFARERSIPLIMLTSGGYMKSSAKVIADSIVNLSSKSLIDMKS